MLPGTPVPRGLIAAWEQSIRARPVKPGSFTNSFTPDSKDRDRSVSTGLTPATMALATSYYNITKHSGLATLAWRHR